MEVLSTAAERVDRSARIVEVASRRATKAGRPREAVADEAAKEMRSELQRAEDEALREHGVSKKDVDQAWAYFSKAHGAELVGRSWCDACSANSHYEWLRAWAETNPSDAEAQRVMRAGWRIKKRSAQLIMTPEILLDVLRTFSNAAAAAVPDAVVQLQNELDDAGAMDMPRAKLLELLSTRSKAMSASLNKRGEAQLAEEWGITLMDVQGYVRRYTTADRGYEERAQRILSVFTTQLNEELVALQQAYGLG